MKKINISIVKLADFFDEKKLFRYADRLDLLLKKASRLEEYSELFIKKFIFK